MRIQVVISSFCNFENRHCSVCKYVVVEVGDTMYVGGLVVIGLIIADQPYSGRLKLFVSDRDTQTAKKSFSPVRKLGGDPEERIPPPVGDHARR